MPKTKMAIFMLATTVTFSALVVAQASANWFVNGAELKTTAALSATSKVDEATKILVPTLEDFTIECSGSTFNSEALLINGTNGSSGAKSLIFTSCNTVKPGTGCGLATKNQSISTLAVSAAADPFGRGEAKVLVTPSKKTFAEIAFSEGNTCSLAGVQPIKGSVTLGMPTGQTEESAQGIVGLGSTENNSLEIGIGNKVFFVGGKSLLTLASGSKWSFQ